MNLHRSKSSFLTVAFCVSCLSITARAYDYSEPMRCVQALPLGYPESPFVLRFSPEELLAQPVWSRQVDAIVMAKSAPGPIRIGAKALQDTLKKSNLGPALLVELDPDRQELPETLKAERVIVLGTPQESGLVATLARQAGLEVTDGALNGDGFIIKPIKQDRREILLVVSPVARGVLYGAYELEERTGKQGVPRIDQAFVPAFRYRGWPIHNHEVPKPAGVSGRWRYNTSLEYCAFWPRILPYKDYPELGGKEHQAEIRRQQEMLHQEFADCLLYGDTPALFWNVLTLQWAPIGADTARKLFTEKHPGIAAPNDPYALCPSHPETRRYVRNMVRELVETFPELELLVLQLSDEGGNLLCDCDRCKNYPYMDRVVDYVRLTMSTARSVNPRIRFMVFGSGLTNQLAQYYPELGRHPASGLDALKKRLGDDFEGYVLMATTPPGYDVESWLSPNSTILGQGLPLYYLFHWYEAGGPGIVAPISSVMSHLSWPLPVYLDKLKIYGRPGSGMVGGASPVAGMDVAWWHPDLDPQKYMRNWSRAKYGPAAGEFVYQALVDTHKITEAFHLETKPHVSESIDMFRWGPLQRPWAVNMDGLTAVGLGHDDTGQTTLASIATLGWMFPQASQPAEFKTMTATSKLHALGEMDRWLRRFELKEETAVGDRAEAMMAKALAVDPRNQELQRLYGLARGTKALIHLYSDYHRAMVYASVARNTPDPAEKSGLVGQAREHLRRAVENAVVYKESMLPITDKEKLVRLKRDASVLYVAAVACIVREAAFLFDGEFGGEKLLELFDRRIGLDGKDRATPGKS